MPPRDRQTLDLFGAPSPSVEPRPKGKAEPKVKPRRESATPSLFGGGERVKVRHVHIEPVKAQPRPAHEGGRPVPLGMVMGFEPDQDRGKVGPSLRMTLDLADERAVIDDGSYGETWISEAKREPHSSRKLKPEEQKDAATRLAKLKTIIVLTEEFKARRAAYSELLRHNEPVGVGPALRGDYGIVQATMSSRPDLVAAYVEAVRRLDALIQSLGGRPGDIHSITI